jgi:hypothetical protein
MPEIGLPWIFSAWKINKVNGNARVRVRYSRLNSGMRWCSTNITTYVDDNHIIRPSSPLISTQSIFVESQLISIT